MGEIYVSYEYWFAAGQLILAMVGMGATLTLADFKDIAKEPRAVFIGTSIQFVLPPLIAYSFISLFDLHVGVAIGLALLAAIPGGTTSNVFTYFARGNVPLSISITGITTLGCLVFTPFVLGLLIIEHLPSDFVMPTQQIISDICFTLLLPLYVGMLILKFMPKYADTISKWCIRGALLGILFIIVGSASAGRLNLSVFGSTNVMIVCCFIITLLIGSVLLTKFLGLSKPDRIAVDVELVVRNVNLALLIKASMFPASALLLQDIGDMVLFTALLFGGIQMLIAGVIILKCRKSSTTDMVTNN